MTIDSGSASNNAGAYGFRLICPQADGPLRDLVECNGDAPVVSLGWRLASTARDHEHVSEDTVRFGARGGSSIEVSRTPPAIRFDLAQSPVADALVHPLGTVPLAILARWRGDITLHAGCFATARGAWAVVGPREAGKSTMLATLAERGVPLLADDLITVLDGVVWPGPSCVDLRPDIAARFPHARDLGIVGGRQRFRLSTVPGPEQLRLEGIFVLEWRDDDATVTVEDLTVEARLRLLYDLEYVALVGPPDPHSILELVDVPAWRITRPRHWDATDEAVSAILHIAGHRPESVLFR